jgi:hypothetical protein
LNASPTLFYVSRAVCVFVAPHRLAVSVMLAHDVERVIDEAALGPA